jgi:hypothetical protein
MSRFARTLDATKPPNRRPAMTESERPPPSYPTHPAPPGPPYIQPGSTYTQPSPNGVVTWGPLKRGMGAAAVTLLIIGSLVIVLAGAGMFGASTVFVEIFFATWVAIGTVVLVGGVVITALR